MKMLNNGRKGQEGKEKIGELKRKHGSDVEKVLKLSNK